MKESDVEIVLQRAREKFPDATPRIISDNGPQFIAKDFKEFVRICGMTHVKISPYYPQSNGKLERYHRTLKSDCIRPNTPLSLEDAKRVVSDFVEHYNNRRLHSRANASNFFCDSRHHYSPSDNSCIKCYVIVIQEFIYAKHIT
jgi:transposase InsO family protein